LRYSRLCESFPGRFPTEIDAEIDRLPAGFLFHMLEAGAYARVKAAVDAADTEEKRKRLPKGELFTLVVDIEHELAEAEIDK
jgi:hypothetical protein